MTGGVAVGDKQKIMDTLLKRFPNNDIAPNHFCELLNDYAQSSLRAPHFVAEIETADEQKLWSCIWEAMLYRHLRSLSYTPLNYANASGQNGPDFSIEHQGIKIWIEAVVPSPKGIPAEWLETPKKGEIKVKTRPDVQRVLRCASVIRDKQKKFAEYQKNKIAGPSDCTVIAVNICRLSDFDIDGTGVSHWPLVMEAVFPIGPLAVQIRDDGKLGAAQNIPRFAIKKASGTDVQTDNFLNRDFSNVSAVLQAHQKDMHQKELFLLAIHNPCAINPLPRGLFRAYKEIVAVREGDYLRFSNVAPKTAQ